jgi:hypothetical protein
VIKMNNEIKNPLTDIKNTSEMSTPLRLSFFEKIGLICAIIFFAIVLIFTLFSAVIDIFVKFNFANIFIDILFIWGSLMMLYLFINLIRKKVVTETLIDVAFQQGVYQRLEPVLENIAEEQVGIDVVLDRLSTLDKKVENISKAGRSETKETGPVGTVRGIVAEMLREEIILGTSLRFLFKAMFMVILTMAAFMFFVSFDLGLITPYVVLSIFFLWWLFITGEYSLWNETGSWIFIAFPIIMIPVTVIVVSSYLNYNVLMAMLYSFIGIYTFTYFIWAVYKTTGSIPFITIRSENPESEFFASQRKNMFLILYAEAKTRLGRLNIKK